MSLKGSHVLLSFLHGNQNASKEIQLNADLDGTLRRLPFKFHLVDPADCTILFPIQNEKPKPGLDDSCRCYEHILNTDKPCHEAGVTSVCGTVKRTRRPVSFTCTYTHPERKNVIDWTAYPLLKKTKELELIAFFGVDITYRMELEKKVSESDLLLGHLHNELFETNRALAIMAKNIERQREEAAKRIAKVISSKVMPIVASLASSQNQVKTQKEIELVQMILNDLVRGLTDSDGLIAEKLSNTEIKIAAMIKNGMSSGEIANHLFISLETVKTHRRNIRKKLGIQNTTFSLSNYFRDMSQGD